MKNFKLLIGLGILFLLIAMGFLLYPTVSNIINDIGNESKLASYSERVSSLDKEEEDSILQEAKDYNEHLSNVGDEDIDKTFDYDSILDIDNGIMGSVEIPKINVKLPIYHGVDDETLEDGAGHMESTSFPIGGENTHSVISAHTAYPGKVFFNDLPKLEKGDVFFVSVLDKKLEYKVCDINIVDPNDDSLLGVQEDRDLVSLLTCYPYAVNTHRLIVTGERVLNVSQEDMPEVIKDNSFTIILGISIAVALVMIAIVVIILVKRKKGRKEGCNKS